MPIFQSYKNFYGYKLFSAIKQEHVSGKHLKVAMVASAPKNVY